MKDNVQGEARSFVDSIHRFSNRVNHYVRSRPKYPAGVLDILREEVALTPSFIVADIGSGTGISAELFLAHGNIVYGIEPNVHMRNAAEFHLKDWPAFRSVAGRAEETGLEPASVDLIVAGQSFHWFDTSRARVEFNRILKPGGWILLMWNTRQVDGTPFLAAYESLLKTYGTDYEKVRHTNIHEGRLRDFFAPGSFRTRELYTEQLLDHPGLEERLRSSSYTPSAGDPGYQPMIDTLANLFQQYGHDGCVRLEYMTQLFIGRLDPIRKSV